MRSSQEVADTPLTVKKPFGIEGILGRHFPCARDAVWLGRCQVAAIMATRITVRTAKFSRVGNGAYSIKAPPTNAAPAIPMACAAAPSLFLIYQNRFLVSGAVSVFEGVPGERIRSFCQAKRRIDPRIASSKMLPIVLMLPMGW